MTPTTESSSFDTLVLARATITLPPGFALGHATIDGDPHAAGQLAARRALDQLVRVRKPIANARAPRMTLSPDHALPAIAARDSQTELGPNPLTTSQTRMPMSRDAVMSSGGAATRMALAPARPVDDQQLATWLVTVGRAPRMTLAPDATPHMGMLDVEPRLAYDGTRPIVVGADLAISITHGKTRAFAIAAPVQQLGIDLCDDADRVMRLADRYLATERTFAKSARELATCFAAKEAGLKALGLGLLDGGMFDECAVHVLSLDPPRLDVPLTLVLGTVPEGVVAIAYR